MILAAVPVAFALAYDLARPPSDQISTSFLLGGIGAYQKLLSPLGVAAGFRCRFEPSCSHYAHDVIAADGSLIGGGRALWRIARCGPWTAFGTQDPP